MHIHPISGDKRHKCAVVASASRLTLSNIDLRSRHPRSLQVKLWATIWTLMGAQWRECAARKSSVRTGEVRVRGRLVARGPPNVSRETL